MSRYRDTSPARETFALFGDDEHGSDDRRELASILWNIRGAK